jgi:hypothetical protein
MSVSPFFRVIGIKLEPIVHNITQTKGRGDAALVVLACCAAHWDRNICEINWIGVLYLVDAFKALL